MRLINFVVCDDVRAELGNKQSLMGVYGDQMLLETLDPAQPFAIRFAVYFSTRLEPKEPVPDVVRIAIALNSATALQHDIPVDRNNPSRTIATGVNVPQLIFTGLGELSVEVSYYLTGSLVGGPFRHTVDLVNSASK